MDTMTTETDTVSTVHPIRAAIIEAETRVTQSVVTESAADAEYASDPCDAACVAADAAYDARVMAEEALSVARQRLVGSDCPREWTLTEDGGDIAEVTALSAREAIEVGATADYSDYADDDDRRGTIWVDIYASCEESGEEEMITFQLDPPEPDCVDGDHDWQDESVQGHGGGVVIAESCLRCGVRRTTDTWAHRPDTGEQGFRSVKYRPTRTP